MSQKLFTLWLFRNSIKSTPFILSNCVPSHSLHLLFLITDQFECQSLNWKWILTVFWESQGSILNIIRKKIQQKTVLLLQWNSYWRAEEIQEKLRGPWIELFDVLWQYTFKNCCFYHQLTQNSFSSIFEY